MIKQLLLPLMAALTAQAQMHVVTDFEGGNAEVVALDPAAGRVRIMPALHEGRGWPCWWSLRLEGLQPGQEVTLEVQAQTKPFRPNAVLNASWCQPDRAALSHDGSRWVHSAPVRRTEEKTAIYKVKPEGTSLWLAWGPPFVPSDAEKLLAGIAAKLGDEAARFELAKTRNGRPVKGIRIGKADAPSQVWVNARQHAWEAGGSWVGRGFAEWFASDEARELRTRCCLHFIPLIDVDNASIGAGGKEALPQDHNRDWSDAPHYPEVAAAQARIREIEGEHGLDVFIDLHNPGAGDRAPFFFGPFGFERMTGPQQQNYKRWIDLAVENINGPLKVEPKYRFATYVKTDEERGRMSSGWVRSHTSERAISVTLETAWNHPHSTVEGYLTIGQQLGRTLAAWLR